MEQTKRGRAWPLRRLGQQLSLASAVAMIAGSPALAQPGLEGTLGPIQRVFEELARYGIQPDASLIGDVSNVLAGGDNPRSTATRVLLHAGLEIDTEKAIGWPGGILRADYLGFHGDDGSLDTGDLQVYSNIDAAPFDTLYSLWYGQSLFRDQLRIKGGKMDANTDFAYVDNGVGFIHSSPGFSPTIQAFPSYPDPSIGINAFWHDAAGPYIGGGVYDGATQLGRATGTRGPSSVLDGPSATFYIGEAGLNYAVGDRPGRIGVGYWHHTGDFERLAGAGAAKDGTSGTYLTWDQSLYASRTGLRGVDAFVQYGVADDAVSLIERHLGVGAQLTGLFPDRPTDISGLMVSTVGLSETDTGPTSASHETALEVFYGYRLRSWIELKPDFQYIVNAGGRQEDVRVATLRMRLAF